MRHRSRQFHVGGFTLLQTVIVLALLVLFMLMSTQLFIHTLRTTRSAQQQRTQIFLSQRAAERLRADVWRADELMTPAENELTVELPEQRVTWRSAGDGALTRRADSMSGTDERAMTFHLNQPLRFEADATMLRIHGGGHPVTMLSQVKLWEAQRR